MHATRVTDVVTDGLSYTATETNYRHSKHISSQVSYSTSTKHCPTPRHIYRPGASSTVALGGRGKQIDLTLPAIIAPHKQSPARRIPRRRRQTEAVTLREAIGRALGRIHSSKDILVPSHAIRRSDRIILAICELREWDLHHLEARRGLPVPRAVEGDVHVLGVGVEGVPDGRAVGLEAEARGSGRGAVGVGVGGVRGEDEVAARLESAVGEGSRRPDREAGRVAVPGIADLEGVADWATLVSACFYFCIKLLGWLLTEVELLSRVVDVDVGSAAADGASEILCRGDVSLS